MRAVAPSFVGPLLTGFFDAMEPVRRFPRMGRVVPEFQLDHLREIIFENYRIVYVIDGDTISVVSVLHASMDVAARLRDRGIDA